MGIAHRRFLESGPRSSTLDQECAAFHTTHFLKLLVSLPRSRCLTVEFCAPPFLHLSVAKQIAGARHNSGFGLAGGQLPPLRIPGSAYLPMAYCAFAGDIRRHLGYRPMSAETVELLSRWGHLAYLCRFNGAAHDLVSLVGAIFFEVPLTPQKPSKPTFP